MEREELLREMLHQVPRTIKKLMSGFRIPEGMSRQTFMLLQCIRRHEGRSMRFYSDHLILPKSNMTAAASRLISEGHVRRVADPADRRVIYLSLTESGREYIDNGMKVFFEDYKKKFSRLEDEDIERLKFCFDEINRITRKL